MAQITDGTSYTIMTVEASDERAVVWTRPDDFTYDQAKPIAGLVGLRQGGFLAGFADGSVRRIKASVKRPTLDAGAFSPATAARRSATTTSDSR